MEEYFCAKDKLKFKILRPATEAGNPARCPRCGEPVQPAKKK